MRRKFQFLLLLLMWIPFESVASVGVGDIVFISYMRESSSPNNGFFTMLARKEIPAGTVLVLSNYYYSLVSGNQAFSSTKTVSGGGGATYTAGGEITITLSENLSLGQTFQVSFDNTGNNNTSSVGTVSCVGVLDFAPTKEGMVVWLYEKSGSTKTTITGLMRADRDGSVYYSDLHELPPGIVWTSLPNHTSYSSWYGANATALNVNESNSSVKCGTWNPYTTATGTTLKPSQDFTANLELTFYDVVQWVVGTSNTVNACSQSDVQSKVCDGYLATYISFDKYRYGFSPSTWEQYSTGSGWQIMTFPSSPDWSTTTSSKEVWIYQNLTLGSFNPNSPSSSTYECGKLIIRDQVNDEVTLTVETGNVLKVNHSIQMSELTPGNGPPKIYLKSSISTEAPPKVYHATIYPTTAQLSGTYRVEKYISDPEWHHFKSPVKVKLNEVDFSAGATTTFSFDYTGSMLRGYKNVYWWDADNSSEVFWQPVTSSTGEDYFSDRGYTIYFESGDVPTVMTVTGTIKHLDPDSVVVLPAEYKSVSVTSPGQGAPQWTTSDKAGWNFYGNPSLAYIKYADLIANYGGNGKLMNGLNNAVYVWDPNRGGINSTSNYVVNDGLTSNEASYIEPFQAFFLRTVSAAANSNGFVRSKRYQSVSAAMATVSNKNYHEFALELRPGLVGNPQKIYAIPSQQGNVILKDAYQDAVFSGSNDDFFCLFSDSSWYSIKHVPEIIDTLRLQVGALNPQSQIMMEIRKSPFFPSDYGVFLVDKKLGVYHDLTMPYIFQNDLNYNGNRFEWLTIPNGHVGLSEAYNQNEIKVFSSGDVVRIELSENFRNEQELLCTTADGKLILRDAIKIVKEYPCDFFEFGQTYVFSIGEVVVKYIHLRK
jgi:hypothetical protein